MRAAEGVLTPHTQEKESRGLQWRGHQQRNATEEAGRGKERILSYGLQGEPYHTLTLAQ